MGRILQILTFKDEKMHFMEEKETIQWGCCEVQKEDSSLPLGMTIYKYFDEAVTRFKKRKRGYWCAKGAPNPFYYVVVTLMKPYRGQEEMMGGHFSQLKIGCQRPFCQQP